MDRTRSRNKKIILFVHHGASLGGAAISLIEIIRQIDRSKYRIIVLLPEEGPFCDLLSDEGIEYKIGPLFIFYYCSLAKSLSATSLLAFLISLKRLFIFPFMIIGNIIFFVTVLIDKNPDTVVINSSTLLLCGIISKLMKKRVIWHIREVISTENSWLFKKIIASSINFSADTVIVNSEFSRLDAYNLGVKNIAVVYNPIDLKKFQRHTVSEKDLKELRLDRKEKIVGFVGQIYKEKGWRNLTKAAFILTRKAPDTRFIIVGSGYMVKRKNGRNNDFQKDRREDTYFRRIVEDLNIKNNFIFLGQRFDVEKILPVMDCLVFANIVPETFGRVIAEAMSVGVPVVASDIGPSSELLAKGEAGFLVKPNDPRALSEGLRYVLENEDHAKKISEVAKARARKIFDAKKISLKLLEIYDA